MDYLEFYRLKEHPFSNIVDTRFYFNSRQQSNAVLKLRHAIESRRGLSIVVGDIGAGKTTLARRLLEELDEDRYEAALLVIIHSSVSSDWLLKKLALQLEIREVKDSKVEILGQIYRRLAEICEQGRTTVILMDEVQMLKSREIMEEFRGLLNMELADGKMVNMVFFGLPEMDEVLSLDEPLKQRVSTRIRLTAFSEEEAKSYMRHRLEVAEAGKGLFTEEALHAVYNCSHGLPRLINTICDNALLDGFLFKSEVIDEQVIRSVALDLNLSCD
ncbi:MAG: AAA family ATPase [Nitrospiraceae bacterium]|nr:AAA family ATPase [Nitrospiraceae bacterium]